MADSNTSASDSKPDHPSMVGGHAKYIQGAISSALGYSEGEETKRSAVDEMRAANEATQPINDQPAQSTILGTVEKKIGELTGCEGLEKDGEQRIPAQAGIEETNGTG